MLKQMQKYFYINLAVAIPFIVIGQQSGNAVYGSDYSYGKPFSDGKLYVSDSTFLIEGSVLMNVIANEYVATFGVEEEAATLKECNDKIEKRIRNFISELNKSGIKQEDIYVDMTTQNKIYDYKLNEDVAEEYLKGFELKKNISVRIKNIQLLDEMIILASNQQIYDLVKVDYIVSDPGTIYTALFQDAITIIQRKHELYAKATGLKLSPASQVYKEQFYSYYPPQLYKSYTAYSSSDVYSDAGTIKEARKSPTYYYDKIDYSGFDRIINPAVIQPAVEFVLVLQLLYSKN